MRPGTGEEGGEAAGRTDQITAAEHEEYWRLDPTGRQQLLHELYNKRNASDPYATSRDYHLRELEIEALASHLPPGRIVDLGCGNGYTLISLAARLSKREMTGVDFSEELIAGAHELLGRYTLDRAPTFVCGDAMAFLDEQPDASVHGVITERFLLNMPDRAVQKRVIEAIYRILRAGGTFLMCEGSMEGFRGLNRQRAALGLDEISETSADNISAIRFEDADIESFTTEQLGFRLDGKLGFSTYFTISRVLHPLLVAPEKPKFDAKINAYARQLQTHSPFLPGVGSNVVWLLSKPA